ncbi:MAG TPA: Crp/Fnr family transcriptional regulator [Blastocatellia bacterium]|nr:Crp/Fnr family transcriptional regulator [Blastocatellia bacterium]
MQSPYGLEISDSCSTCAIRSGGYFCNFEPELVKAFEALKYATVFPKGAVLFVEGQSPRGVFMLCSGRVKLSTCSSDGKAIITRIAEGGEVLGLSAAVSGKPYMVTGETLVPCQVNFIKRDDFLKFLKDNGAACLRVAEHLSNNYHFAFEQVHSLGLSHSAAEKLAKLMLEWVAKNGRETDKGITLKMTLTHEEIAQLIGTSRETVTRLLGLFKTRQLIHVKGSTLTIRNKLALMSMVSS